MNDEITNLTITPGLPDFSALLPQNAPYAVPLDPMTTDIRPFVNFTPEGRVWTAGNQAVGITEGWIAEGAPYVLGEARWDGARRAYLQWVDWVDGAWKVVPRPELTCKFDKLILSAGEEATMSDLQPAEITFTGPTSGDYMHDGGNLSIGWLVPGQYVVRVDAFPALPVEFTFTVEP